MFSNTEKRVIIYQPEFFRGKRGKLHHQLLSEEFRAVCSFIHSFKAFACLLCGSTVPRSRDAPVIV